MAVCATGTPQAKAGVPAAVLVDQAYMQSILPQPWSFLYPYLPYMHVLEIGDVGAFCAVDPPTYSLPTAEQFLNFVTGGNFGHAIIVRDFFNNLVKSYLWYSLCECSAGSPTAHPAADADPGDLPALNPPDLVGPPATPTCATASSGVKGFGAGTPGRNVDMIGTTGSGGTAVPHPLAPGAQYVRVTYTRAAAGAVHSAIAFTWRPWPVVTATNTFLPGGATMESVFTTDQQTKSADFAVPIGAVGYTVTMQSQVDNCTDTGSVVVDDYCTGRPGSTDSPCCPPDPIATGMLSRILSMVELIQRQSVAFGTVPGTIHTGLADNGTVAVQGLIGALVDITTLPDSYGRQSGDPIEYFGLGFITWGTDDGYQTSVRIEHEHQVIFPPQAGVYTTIGYSLAPGVVITLTELEREP